ncbi:hypothetical protein [Geobacillus subterraneus]|uniref:hypothetical protein n=1 Tax=Geobacillus subterraneus TaxID=129338 RepID=UPI001613E943
MKNKSEELKALIQTLEKQLDPIKRAAKNLEYMGNLAKNISIDPVLVKNLVAIQETSERLAWVSKDLIPSIIIKNNEVFTSLHSAIVDAVISLQKTLAEKAEILRSVSIPHMPLYRNILDSIDEDSYEQIQTVMEDESFYYNLEEELNTEENDLDEGEMYNIVNPHFFNVAIKINIYMTATDNHIHSNPNVTEEEKSLWDKVIKPILSFILQIFIAWAIGNTPITEMQIVKQFEKIAELIEDYQYPIETTDIDSKTEEM